MARNPFSLRTRLETYFVNHLKKNYQPLQNCFPNRGPTRGVPRESSEAVSVFGSSTPWRSAAQELIGNHQLVRSEGLIMLGFEVLKRALQAPRISTAPNRREAKPGWSQLVELAGKDQNFLPLLLLKQHSIFSQKRAAQVLCATGNRFLLKPKRQCVSRGRIQLLTFQVNHLKPEVLF